MRGLRGKVVVVAGGARGIGAATALRLAAEGASVVVGDLDGDGAEAAAASVRAEGGEAVALAYDAVDAASVRALADTAVSTFGGLDGWHNNAADTSEATAVVDFSSDALTLPIAVWHRAFAVDLEGYLHGVRAAVPLLLERGGGALVHTSSDAAFSGLPTLPAYSSAKNAIFALNRHVAARWGREGIRSNVVSPGVILTESSRESMTDERRNELARAAHAPRIGQPEDIAAAVAFLLSADAAFVNGQVLSVNGGSVMR